MSPSTAKRYRTFGFVLLAGLMLFFAFNLHSKVQPFEYRSQIYSDKSGYYVYLPATFLYGFQEDRIRESMPLEPGRPAGFTYTPDGKIKTKYTAGVAMMQLPFWLVTHYVVAPLTGQAQTGYSPIYHSMIDVCGVVYTLLALLLLWPFLRAYFSPRETLLTLLVFLFGTSIFYYATVESGMSHAYTLFQTSLYLLTTQRILKAGKISPKNGLLLGLAGGLLLLTRPTNLLILPAFFLLDLKSTLKQSITQDLKNRAKMLLSQGGALTLATAFLILLPQILYWRYAYGQTLVYSYEGESFKYLGNPQLAKLWFAPHNGLLVHLPILLGSLIGMGLMWFKRRPNALYLPLLFLTISYVFASWWSWNFGCGFGIRAFVDYFPFLMLPFGYLLQRIFYYGIALRTLSLGLIVVLALLTFKNMYLYKLCFYGEHDWDWAPWWEMMLQF